MAGNVFISYSSKEMGTAKRIKDILEINGISCWMAPESIGPGSSYTREIPRGIKECKVLLLLLSEQSQASIWVEKEVERAVSLGKIIIPFEISQCDITDSFDFMLSNVQRWAAYEEMDANLERLVKQIWSLLSIDEKSAVKVPNKQNTEAFIDETAECEDESQQDTEYYEEERKHCTICFDVAYHAEKAGQTDRAIEYYKNATEFLKPGVSGTWSDAEVDMLLLCCSKTGNLLLSQNEFEQAIRYFENGVVYGEAFCSHLKDKNAFRTDCFIDCGIGLLCSLASSVTELLDAIRENAEEREKNYQRMIEKLNRFYKYFERFAGDSGQYLGMISREGLEKLFAIEKIMKYVVTLIKESQA